MERIETWEAPPISVIEGNYAPNKYAEVVEQLRNNKGEWALLQTRPSPQAAKSLAANIRKGRLGSFTPAGAFEAQHNHDRVWVRYIGDPENAPPPPSKRTRLNPSPAAVRAWARARGIPVSDRGSVPQSLIQQWIEATQGDQ